MVPQGPAGHQAAIEDETGATHIETAIRAQAR